MRLQRIISGVRPATYRSAHHGASGEQLPAEAYARFHGQQSEDGVEITSLQFPNLSDHQLQEKAIAILRARKFP